MCSEQTPGILPLARQLAEIVGRGPHHPRDGTLELQPTQTRVTSLNPHAWGFASREEMEAAFTSPNDDRKDLG